MKFLSTFAAIEPEAGTAQKANEITDKPSPFSLIELD